MLCRPRAAIASAHARPSVGPQESEIAAALATVAALGSAFESAGIGGDHGGDGSDPSNKTRANADDANGAASRGGSGEGDPTGGNARPEDAFATVEVSGV